MDPDSFIHDTQKVQFSDPTQRIENQSQDDTLKLSLKYGDSVSPWLERIKDPFQDPQITPARKAQTSIPHITPSSVGQNRQRHSFDTPPTARAHKVFSKLRDHDAEQEELEYGTQKEFLVPQQTPDDGDEEEDPDDTFFKQPDFSLTDSPFKKPSSVNNKPSQSMIEVPQSVQRRRKMDVVQTQSPPAEAEGGSIGVDRNVFEKVSNDVPNGVVIDSDEDAHTQLIVPDSRSFDEVPATTPYEDTLSLRHSRRIRDKSDKNDRTDKTDRTDFIEESSPAVRGKVDYLQKRLPSSPYRKKEVLSQKSFSDVETPILKRRRVVESSDEPKLGKLSLESKSRSTTPELSESVSESVSQSDEAGENVNQDVNLSKNGISNHKENQQKLKNEQTAKSHLSDSSHKSVWLRNGSKIYPATVLESGSDTLDVSTGSEILTVPFKAIVSPLDIRVGDKVKTKTLKSADSVVLSLEHSSEPAIQCVNGFDLVVLQTGTAITRVPLSQVYMNSRHWRLREKVSFYHDKGLFQKYLESLCHVNSKKYLPSSPSKVRVKYMPTRNLDKGVFYGCIFFITHSGKGKIHDRNQLASLILENGGMVYEEGYTEILKIVSNSETPFFQPVSLLEKFNFGAVISNTFCRSPKYIQTLALGWPVLSDHFIADAIRNPQRMFQWEAYLLPSGECTSLSTVKSCNVMQFSSNFDKGCSLRQQLKNNAHVLEKYALFVVGEFDSDILEFLLTCLGIKCVVAVRDVGDFFKKVSSRLGDRVLFYSEEGIPRINAVLQENWQLHKEQFRQIPSFEKKSSEMENFQLEKVTGNSQPTGERWLEVDLVDKEWIIQCVIGGADWDCEYTWKGAY